MKDEWDGITLEEWAEKMMREGHTVIVTYMINLMPEEKKEKFRDIWRKIQAEKRKEIPEDEL